MENKNSISKYLPARCIVSYRGNILKSFTGDKRLKKAEKYIQKAVKIERLNSDEFSIIERS